MGKQTLQLGALNFLAKEEERTLKGGALGDVIDVVLIWPGGGMGWGLFSSSYFPGTVLGAGEFALNKAVLCSPGNRISGAMSVLRTEGGVWKGLGVLN